MVLGQTVADALFPNGQDPLGKYVLVKNILFQVIGTMSPRGASPMGQDQDDVVLIPYSTGSLRLFGQKFLRNITVAVKDVNDIDDAQEALEKLLRERHGTTDFQIRNMASLRYCLHIPVPKILSTVSMASSLGLALGQLS